MNMNLRRIRAAAALSLGALAAMPAATPALAAGFDGETVRFHHIFHSTEFFAQDITGGPGVEVSEFFTFDLDGLFFQLTLNPGVNFNTSLGVIGPVITDTADTLPAILGVELVFSTFESAPIVTWTENQIVTDFSQSGELPATTARFEVTFGPEAEVPLPAGGALAAAALAALAAVSRRKGRGRGAPDQA